MQFLRNLIFFLVLGAPTSAMADGGFLSIPAAAFSGNQAAHNISGTATFIRTTAFAPVHLPDTATVTFFGCGARAMFRKELILILRRNDPQQANVDMATVRTGLDETGFVHLETTEITEAAVNNRRFNYFIVADSSKPGGNQPGNRAICNFDQSTQDPAGTQCSVGYCRIGYTLP